MDIVQTPNTSEVREKRKSVDINNLKNENMNYIDTSDVIVQYYKNQRVSGLEKYFLMIEDWLKDDKSDNTPLVIQADEGVGKKTLLVKWMEYHKQNKATKYQDYMIAHFATTGGNNSNYFFAIYRILIKLREALNITQKVELLEEKLRRYFAYWLELSNKELDQQIVKDAKIIYDKVILIFEGIDHFREQNDLYSEANVAFWLPRIFPKRIKVIVTAEGSSAAMTHFKTLNCQIMNITSDSNIVFNIIETHMNRETFLSEKRKNELRNLLNSVDGAAKSQALFVRTFVSIFIPYPTIGILENSDVDAQEVEKMLDHIEPEVIRKIKNIEDLIHYILEYFSKVLFQTDKFETLLTIFTITQKGLTINEIKEVCDITQDEWKYFLTFFKMFLMHHRDLWIINNDIFKAVVTKKYHRSQKQIVDLHERIADAINKKTANSIRKLEEHTFHLFMSKSYFKLKEVISIIENFLLLFNPNNKYDLCRYWQKLEEHGFDPVLEYNKAVEGFQIHYHPSAEDIFRIIIQISRFLKEFGDFETFNTPEFRHPPIIGLEKELEDIGLLREILVLNLYYNQDPELKSFKRMEGNQLTPSEKLEMKMENLKQRQSKFKPGGLSKQKQKDDKDDTGYSEKKTEERRKVIKVSVLSELEQLNVEIPQNREQIRNFYLKKMMIKKQDDHQQQRDTNTEPEETKQDAVKFDETRIREQLKVKVEQTVSQVEAGLSVEPEESAERVSTDYYYKRWIWIQFPWACISLKCDYSAIIKQCFSSATNYMSVEEEHAYTNQALKIAVEAKLKKQKMYERNPDENTKSITLAPIKRNGNDSQVSHMASIPSLPNISIIQPNNASIASQISNPVLQRKPNKQDKAFFITQDYLGMNLLNKELQLAKEGKEQSTNPQGGSIERSQDGETTMKMLDRSKPLKNRLHGYQASSISLNSYDVTEVFPTLKNQMNKHTTKEIVILEQQAKIMRKELDQLIYQNQQLAKELKYQKVLEFNKGYIKKELENFEHLKEDLTKLEKQVNETEEEFRYSTLSKERVRTILKICKDNKQQNEDWIRHLNFLINNFKKLIKFEENDIVKCKEQITHIRKIIEEFLVTYREKVKQQKNLVNQIKTSIKKKKDIDTMFKESDSVIEDSALKSIQQLKSNQRGQDLIEKQKKKQSQFEKNAKVITEKLEAYQTDYLKLQPCIDLKDNYSQTASFQKFLQNIEKKQELEASLIQHRQRLEELVKIREQKEQLLKTYQQAITSAVGKAEEQEEQTVQIQEEEEPLIDEAKQESILESKQRELKHFLNIKLDCQMALNTLNEKLLTQNQGGKVLSPQGSFQYNTQKICEQLRAKRIKIQETLGKEAYVQICDGTYDMAQVYKDLIKYSPEPLLANNEIE